LPEKILHGGKWFLQGVFAIYHVFWLVNRGESVVICVVEHGALHHVFPRMKNTPLFRTLFLTVVLDIERASFEWILIRLPAGSKPGIINYLRSSGGSGLRI
jgi:hypothetical protein